MSNISGRGGRRPGAGRPSMGDEKRQRLTVRLAADVLDYLRSHRESAGAVIERAVRAWRDRERGDK